MSKQTDYIHWYGEKTPESVTLRDYFAAAALQGLLANPNQIKSWREYVECAYQTADVMLRVREAKP